LQRARRIAQRSESSDDSTEPDDTERVVVGSGGELTYDPRTLRVEPRTTVEFAWESDEHDLVVESQPKEAD